MKQVGQSDAWQEWLLTASQKNRRGYGVVNPDKSERSIRLRVRLVWLGCVSVVAIIMSRLIYLQIFDSGQKLLLSQNNHIEQVRIPAERGKILGSEGEVLAESVWDQEKSDYVRQYPLGIASSSILGYLSEVKEDEVRCRKGICYSPGMRIGREGLERVLEQRLRGRDGGVIKEIDASGSEVRERGMNESEMGESVKLAVSAELQQAMYEALGEVRGAAVAIDMQGKVLGLVSRPTYEPTNIGKYLADQSENYFLNRAISGLYPPGSVFKLVTSLAGLEAGVIDEQKLVEDTGEIKIGEYRYGNWYFDQYGRREGQINIVKALGRSNDIYFYKVGEWMGINKLVSWAKKMGYGELTGIELMGEAEGLVPDPLWKERRIGESWFLGNTYHMAIGQGDLLVTPAQVARMTLASVTGRLCKLSLLRETKADCTNLGIDSEHLRIVREGMKAACSTGGTAFPFFEYFPYALCKTGTAQHAGQKEIEDKPHAWITVAYPGENPEMVLTVFVEAGGEGSSVAGPIAKKIIEAWRN